jgi:hypothetical protein
MPWWSKDEAARRDESTADVLRRSEEARMRTLLSEKRARELLADYRAADRRLGRMSGR